MCSRRGKETTGKKGADMCLWRRSKRKKRRDYTRKTRLFVAPGIEFVMREIRVCVEGWREISRENNSQSEVMLSTSYLLLLHLLVTSDECLFTLSYKQMRRGVDHKHSEGK